MCKLSTFLNWSLIESHGKKLRREEGRRKEGGEGKGGGRGGRKREGGVGREEMMETVSSVIDQNYKTTTKLRHRLSFQSVRCISRREKILTFMLNYVSISTLHPQKKKKENKRQL